MRKICGFSQIDWFEGAHIMSHRTQSTSEFMKVHDTNILANLIQGEELAAFGDSPFPLEASPLFGSPLITLSHCCWWSVPCSPTTARGGEPTAAAAAYHPPTDGSSRPACRTPTDHRTASHVTRQRARIGSEGMTRSGVAAPCVRRRGNCYVMASREGVGSCSEDR